jgi:hypothetical protein
MSVHNAIRLLNQIEDDAVLRQAIYQCDNSGQLSAFLSALGFYFEMNELEDAINYMHVQCQTLEEAQSLLHRAEWLRLLLFFDTAKPAF